MGSYGKSFRKLVAAASIAAASCFAATAASASIFYADYDGVWHAYENETQSYGMKFKDDGSKDGFWLVVSDGPNPKTNVNEYAILYGDRANDRITAYTYDGENSADSFKTGKFLAQYENVFSSAGKHPRHGYDLTMFSLDVSAINGAFDTPDWDGVQIGDKSGIWFHQTAGTDFTYGADGSIIDFSFSDQMWTDGSFKQAYEIPVPDCSSEGPYTYVACNPTTPSSSGSGSVPAPGGLLLVIAGLAAVGTRRRA